LREPVVHSDVRPSNLLVSADGRVRLAGFGCARQPLSQEAAACGVLFGGPAYAAPEQLQSRDVSERSDAYSAALVMWELLAGRSATPESLSDSARVQALAHRQVEPLRRLRADLPPLVTTALDACLVADPVERTIRCEEVAGCIAAATDLRAGQQALRDAVHALGAVWEGLATGGPVVVRPLPKQGARSRSGVSLLMDTPMTTRSTDTQPFAARTGEFAVESDGEASWEEVTSVPAPPDSQRFASDEFRAKLPTPVPVPAPGVESPSPAAPSQPRLSNLAARVVFGIPVAMVTAAVTFAIVSSAGWNDRGDQASTLMRASAPQPVKSESIAPKLAATAKSPVASTAVAAEEPSRVPFDQAVLIVRGPPSGYVYVQGTLLGTTDEPILTECGAKFIRVGTEAGPQGIVSVRWLAPGQPVSLRCGSRVELDAVGRDSRNTCVGRNCVPSASPSVGAW
ncbi:MAG: protein kinase, partial [Polyangiaceae bacterium]|nr:protein kinase [Polyangiaceae bacterium]